MTTQHDETPWVALHDVHRLYGYSSVRSAYNAVAGQAFPVETYKLGRTIVIDRAVHEEFFAAHRRSGLAALRKSRSTKQQSEGSDA